MTQTEANKRYVEKQRLEGMAYIKVRVPATMVNRLHATLQQWRDEFRASTKVAKEE